MAEDAKGIREAVETNEGEELSQVRRVEGVEVVEGRRERFYRLQEEWIRDAEQMHALYVKAGLIQLVAPEKDAETETEAPEEEAPVSEVKSHRSSLLESLRKDGRRSLSQMQAYRKSEGQEKK